jgi:hypothetical protein
MSAIFGIIHLDLRPVVPSELELMQKALLPHGRDGSGMRLGEGAGLGWRLRARTPVDLSDSQPCSDSAGNHLLVCDSRLAGRSDLLR